jgi:hypothetical protein
MLIRMRSASFFREAIDMFGALWAESMRDKPANQDGTIIPREIASSVRRSVLKFEQNQAGHLRGRMLFGTVM